MSVSKTVKLAANIQPYSLNVKKKVFFLSFAIKTCYTQFFIIITFLYVVGNNDKTMQWLESPANVFNYRSSSEFLEDTSEDVTQS